MRGFRSSNAVAIGILGFATPPCLRYERARAALRGGKHVIVEKPLAVTMEQADEIVAFARDLCKTRDGDPMPHVPLLETEQAPLQVKTVYEEFHRRMSFPSPPNFIMTQGHSLAVARGTWEVVRNVLVCGEIPRWTKEMMFVAISKDLTCRYCTAAHFACCRMLGVEPDTLDRLVEDITTLNDPKLRDMILFAVKCARNPQSLTDDDYDTLRQHGLQQSEIVEIVGMSALAVYANIIADATAMDPDQMFNSI